MTGTQYSNYFAVVFNGPPGSGKDEICKQLIKNSKHVFHKMFKEKLLELTMAVYNIYDDRFFAIYDDRIQKETPREEFGGLSIRQAMIKVSEEVIKPVFGKKYFGDMAAKNLELGYNLFSDGGFPDELDGIYERTKGNMIIIQLEREGCDFSSDSRNYINNYKDVPTVKIANNGSIKKLLLAVSMYLAKNIVEIHQNEKISIQLKRD